MPSIRLPETFDRQSIEGLAETLRTALSGTDSVTLDASDVERIGQVGLQLLLSASRTASARGVAFEIQNPSNGLCDAVQLTGLGDALAIRAAA